MSTDASPPPLRLPQDYRRLAPESERAFLWVTGPPKIAAISAGYPQEEAEPSPTTHAPTHRIATSEMWPMVSGSPVGRQIRRDRPQPPRCYNRPDGSRAPPARLRVPRGLAVAARGGR